MTFQNEVAEWAEQTFPQSDVKAKLLHLFEELDEMFNATLSCILQEEIADAGLITLHLASSLEVEIPISNSPFQKEMRRKFEICKKRKWSKPDENGVVRHIK